MMEEQYDSTLEFLQALDARHTQVLDDLDALNARIEAVLGEYSQSRAGAEHAPHAACDTPNA